MPRVTPIYSTREQVYHDNSLCTERNNIETRYLAHGTGNRRRCYRCDTLAAEGR